MTEHAFQADTSRVLGLVIDSLYSDKDIFLRELISNAADALDKLRFAALTQPELQGDGVLTIRLSVDREAGVLRIEDNGIGMSEADLIENLGTIARSGTRAFLDRLEEAKRKDVALIGQFGVGFYSAFLVADQVEVVSRAAASEQAFAWKSNGKDGFSVEPAERAGRGTSLVLHLKEEQKQYLEEHTLRQLVRKFSDFVRYPIELLVQKAGPEGEPATHEFERINKGSAPWQEQPSSLSAEVHDELYKHLTHDWEGPLAYSHFRVEGQLEFVALLYVPKHAQDTILDPQKAPGLQLYVKRVLVLDQCDQLLPPYLRFVRGLVDSDDLPLNVSRELLQDSAALRAIQRQLVKRVLDRLEALSTESAADYTEFTKSFGAVLKEGLAGFSDQKERLAKLVRFGTTHGDELTSLEAYVSRMKEGQTAIYFATADNAARLSQAPQLEALRAKGYEILLGTEPIDEFALERIGEFEGKKLLSAFRADLELGGDDEKKAQQEAEAELSPLLTAMRSILGERVESVTVSSRLTDSPACLALGKSAMPAHLEKLFKQRGHALPGGSRVLELNGQHALVRSLLERAKSDPESADLKLWVELLCDQAALAEGSELPDPARFAQHVTQLLSQVAQRPS